MPRYLIERTFPDRIDLPGPETGNPDRQVFIENNAVDGVTWVQSYVVPGKNKSFCIYDAPSPEALRRAAQRNGLPIDRITEVSVLSPYAYLPQDKELK
jgi:hypothetical protein